MLSIFPQEMYWDMEAHVSQQCFIGFKYKVIVSISLCVGGPLENWIHSLNHHWFITNTYFPLFFLT